MKLIRIVCLGLAVLLPSAWTVASAGDEEPTRKRRRARRPRRRRPTARKRRSPRRRPRRTRNQVVLLPQSDGLDRRSRPSAVVGSSYCRLRCQARLRLVGFSFPASRPSRRRERRRVGCSSTRATTTSPSTRRPRRAPTILMTGWQFDRGVKLLRGRTWPSPGRWAARSGCSRSSTGCASAGPGLHVYILAWDFHLVFALEREWMQRLYFHWATNERLHFRFDAHTSGRLPPPEVRGHRRRGFVPGRHRPLRSALGRSPAPRGEPAAAQPRQAAEAVSRRPGVLSRAAMAAALEDLFLRSLAPRGRRSHRAADRSPSSMSAAGRYQPAWRAAVPPGPVALSRTDARDKGARSKHEIRRCWSTRSSRRALHLRRDPVLQQPAAVRSPGPSHAATRRPKLEIVLLVNERAEAVKEEIAVGLRQAQIVADLRRAAAETGHAFASTSPLADGRVREAATYIHSKLMIVDDRFLTVGSANFTNRSMGIDSELNACGRPAADGTGRVEAAIRRARISLLTEHIGRGRRDEAHSTSGDIGGLNRFLDGWCFGSRPPSGVAPADPGPIESDGVARSPPAAV